MKVWILLLWLFVSLSAQAADWIKITAGKDGNQYFYDRSKLFISDDEITYWKKVIFKLPQPLKEKKAVRGLFRERIQCTEHTLQLISHLFYGADGSVIEYVATHEDEASPIIPDTLGDAFEQALCPLTTLQPSEPLAEIAKLPSGRLDE